MTDCAFKIGETYRDREGGEWVMVARNDGFGRPLTFRSVSSSAATTRMLDGTVGPDPLNRAFDILPNPKRVWVVTYKRDGKDVVLAYDCETAAQVTVKSCHHMNSLSSRTGQDKQYTDIRGPMLWEDKA